MLSATLLGLLQIDKARQSQALQSPAQSQALQSQEMEIAAILADAYNGKRTAVASSTAIDSAIMVLRKIEHKLDNPETLVRVVEFAQMKLTSTGAAAPADRARHLLCALLVLHGRPNYERVARIFDAVALYMDGKMPYTLETVCDRIRLWLRDFVASPTGRELVYALRAVSVLSMNERTLVTFPWRGAREATRVTQLK